MPEIDTPHFGRLGFEEDSIVEFPAGLPGFENERRFLLVDHAASRPVAFLQSASQGRLCFITMPVPAIAPGFRLTAASEDLRLIGLEGARQPEIGVDVLCLGIISIADDGTPTADLLAPVLINLQSGLGVQAIQEEPQYSHCERLPLPPEGSACL